MTQTTVRLDYTEWDRTIKEYIAGSSRSAEKVYNSEGANLFYMARDVLRGTHGNNIASEDAILEVIENPKFITWYLNTTFGYGNWGRNEWYAVTLGENRDYELNETTSSIPGGIRRKGLGQRKSAVKFMYAMLTKMAARMIEKKKIPFDEKFKNQEATKVVKKTKTDFSAELTGLWTGSDAEDGIEKLGLFEHAIKRALPFVTEKMNKKIASRMLNAARRRAKRGRAG